MPVWLQRIKDTWSWGRFAWQLAGALGFTGLISSVGGSVWAMILGVPTPIALMVGYCTLVGAVYLAMAPLAYRVLSQAPANKAARKSEAPNYTAWRLVPDYRLDDAAHLWCDVDPNDSGTYDTAAWFRVLKAKVQDRTLKLNSGWPADRRMQDAEIADADPRVRITRASLQAFAAANGFDPRFLREKD